MGEGETASAETEEAEVPGQVVPVQNLPEEPRSESIPPSALVPVQNTPEDTVSVGSRVGSYGGGRWSQFPPLGGTSPDLDARAYRWAELLLGRYGVVFKTLLSREPAKTWVIWPNLFWSCSRLGKSR